jgi:hypothetical protein
VALSDYQVFHEYTISKYTLGNEDHALRHVSGLEADGLYQRVTISVLSASGAKFIAKARGAKFRYVCTPVGPNCRHRRWSAKVIPPKVPRLTASDKAHVRQILVGNVTHYVAELDQGVRVLGSEQYSNANAGLAAMGDPSSAAARFREYRQHPGPERDLSFDRAFARADHYFTAANEPAAISAWRDDMTQAQSDLSEWINAGVSWQIREVSADKLRARETKVRSDLAKARAAALRASA